MVVMFCWQAIESRLITTTSLQVSGFIRSYQKMKTARYYCLAVFFVPLIQPLKGSVKVPAESPPQFAGEASGVHSGGSGVLYLPFRKGGRSLFGIEDVFIYCQRWPDIKNHLF